MSLIMLSFILHTQSSSLSPPQVDYRLIIDMVPTLARLYFLGRTDVQLNVTQSVLLLAVGLQLKTIDAVEAEIAVGATQLLALFNKTIRKLSTFLRAVEEKGVSAEILAASGIKSSIRPSLIAPSPAAAAAAGAGAGAKGGSLIGKPHGRADSSAIAAAGARLASAGGVGASAAEGAGEGEGAAKKTKSAMQKLLSALDVKEFEISGTDADWEAATAGVDVASGAGVGLKSSFKAQHRQEMRANGTPAEKKRAAIQSKIKKFGGAGKRASLDEDD